jgi:hypothetical protein
MLLIANTGFNNPVGIPFGANAVATVTETKIAVNHPKVIATHPLPFPFVPFNEQVATTPLPSKISNKVPTNSLAPNWNN